MGLLQKLVILTYLTFECYQLKYLILNAKQLNIRWG